MTLPSRFQQVEVFKNKRERDPSVTLKHNGQLIFSKVFNELIGKQSKTGECKHLRFGYDRESKELAIAFDEKPTDGFTITLSSQTVQTVVGIKRVINTLNDNLSPLSNHRFVFRQKDGSLEINFQKKYCILRFDQVEPVPIMYRNQGESDESAVIELNPKSD